MDFYFSSIKWLKIQLRKPRVNILSDVTRSKGARTARECDTFPPYFHFLRSIIMKKYDCKNCAKVYTSKTIENYFETQEWEFLIEDPVIELHGSGTLTRKMFCTNCKDVYITDEYGSSDMELEVEGPSPRGFGLDSDSDQSDQYNNDDVSVSVSYRFT